MKICHLQKLQLGLKVSYNHYLLVLNKCSFIGKVSSKPSLTKHAETDNLTVMNSNEKTPNSKGFKSKLLEMTDNQQDLPQLFRKVINNLDNYNAPARQQKRKQFALKYSYQKQTKKIFRLIE